MAVTLGLTPAKLTKPENAAKVSSSRVPVAYYEITYEGAQYEFSNLLGQTTIMDYCGEDLNGTITTMGTVSDSISSGTMTVFVTPVGQAEFEYMGDYSWSTIKYF